MICALGATRKSILERKKSIYECPLTEKQKTKKRTALRLCCAGQNLECLPKLPTDQF